MVGVGNESDLRCEVDIRGEMKRNAGKQRLRGSMNQALELF